MESDTRGIPPELSLQATVTVMPKLLNDSETWFPIYQIEMVSQQNKPIVKSIEVGSSLFQKDEKIQRTNASNSQLNSSNIMRGSLWENISTDAWRHVDKKVPLHRRQWLFSAIT